MATILQKKVFKDVLIATKKGEKKTMGEIILKNGGSINTSLQPNKITNSKGWLELKKKYLQDELALQTFNDLAGRDNPDKDNRLKASIEILKLNDRYPKQSSVIVGLFNKIEALEE